MKLTCELDCIGIFWKWFIIPQIPTMWNLKANCPTGNWSAWCPVIEFPTSEKCKKHHSTAHGGNLFNILNAENRDVRSRSEGMDKRRNCGCISAMWHLVKWSPTIRQPILVRFGQSQVKQTKFNAFRRIQEPFLLKSFKMFGSGLKLKLDDAWPLFWIILDYLGSYPFEIVTPTYTRLLEAVITCRLPMGFQNIYRLRKLLFLVLGARCHHLAFCQINANMSGWSWN